MSRELLSNLGYHIIKEEHTIGDTKNVSSIKMCVDFTSKKFIVPKYSPPGISLVDCESTTKNCKRLISDLKKNIISANKDKAYLKRLGGKLVGGGIILVNDNGIKISKETIEEGLKSNFYFWDIHRVFFYCMKVFSHSILENWVSQSSLGVVLTEQEIKTQFESNHYFTTTMIGIRHSEQTQMIEIYFTYFVDCLQDPHNISPQNDSLHTENVQRILDDVYERMEKLTEEFYPEKQKSVTVEIHSLSGFTEDAEYKVKLYAQHHRNWKKLKISDLIIDEHTLFKYAVIPWEAVMDYAFTKKTGRHTHNPKRIPQILEAIEDNFAKEFARGIKSSQILEPFNQAAFLERPNETHVGYTTLLAAHVTKTPIKQRLLIFSRTGLNEPKNDELKKIIKDIRTKTTYNYDWIGIMSGSGFTHEGLDYVKSFNEQGIGLGFIDAVTKQLIVNKNTNEGAHLNQMFLSECIT